MDRLDNTYLFYVTLPFRHWFSKVLPITYNPVLHCYVSIKVIYECRVVIKDGCGDYIRLLKIMLIRGYPSVRLIDTCR